MTEEGFKDVHVVKLGSDNYQRWLIELEDALRSLGLWRHVTGKVTKPREKGDGSNEKEVDEWDRKDSKARSVIRRTLDEVCFNHVRDCLTSKGILDRIRELREPKTVSVLLEALKDFMTFTWKESDDVASFMSGLSVIVG